MYNYLVRDNLSRKICLSHPKNHQKRSNKDLLEWGTLESDLL